MAIEDKACVACGRRIEWRRKWARDWDQVRYCSDSCRRRKVKPQDAELERAILALLAGKKTGATIDPSDAAQAVRPDGWQDLVEDAHAAARRLADRGDVVITQGGRIIDPSTARGPIRIRRA